MIRIEHIAIWTLDIERLCAFYTRYFAAQIGPLYHNPNKGFRSRFLSFAGSARIEVMSLESLPGQLPPAAPQPGYAHLALSLGSAAAVDALAARMQADGIPLVDGPRQTGDGYYEAVVLDPDGNRLEITV